MNTKRNYIGNLSDARYAARKIQAYYEIRGYTEVRVWVEKEQFGERNGKPHYIYVIRSNLRFELPE